LNSANINNKNSNSNQEPEHQRQRFLSDLDFIMPSSLKHLSFDSTGKNLSAKKFFTHDIVANEINNTEPI